MTSKTDAPFIHPLSDVQAARIGPGSRIWQYVVILPGATVGEDCNICSHCFIENDVVIGDRVTIKSGVQLWDGLRVGDDVFIGPNASFTNDRFPRSGNHEQQALHTTIQAGASIGAGATVLPGVQIGRHSMVGAGAVVTKSVPANAIVVGSPARIVGYVDAGKRDLRAPKRPTTTPPRVRGVALHELPTFSDIRGGLVVGEIERLVPFQVNRYFMVMDVPSAETRGEHAHRQCHQFLNCVHGSVSVLVDDGTNREEFRLDRPNLALHIPPMVWGVQYKYSQDAVLLVFASHPYDDADYIRSYDEFLDASGQPE